MRKESYNGLTDGNYAQDRGYDIPNSPWLVDLDLRKMHDLGCNFGMGSETMFYGEHTPLTAGPEGKETYTDRFLAATVAFGHPGFLCSGGMDTTLRGYYLIQQLAANYTLSPVGSIGYLDETGRLLDSSAAIASGAYRRNQIVTEYANGTVTMVNGNKTERMKYGSRDLPPNGYCGQTQDQSIVVASTDSGPGTPRYDYCVSPAYVYIDGRGHFTRLNQAASDGIGICRVISKRQWEIIPYRGAECGFELPPAKAVALDKGCREMGPAELRVSRGLTYVVPVEGAFSYLLTATSGEPLLPAPRPELRDRVIAGETVPVTLGRELAVEVPTDEGAELLGITLSAGKLTQKIERGLRTVDAPKVVVALPMHYDTGICLRGGRETNDFATSLGYVIPRSVACGGASKDAIAMHPPYQGRVGHVFAMYDTVTLPKDRPAAFRAVVGKADGSDLGDGILYKLAVVDESGTKTIVAEKTVRRHEWLPIEADLSKWAGQTLQLELISDVGTQDNPAGDWACWAEMRVESVQPVLQRTLEPSAEAYRREPPPVRFERLSPFDDCCTAGPFWDGLRAWERPSW